MSERQTGERQVLFADKMKEIMADYYADAMSARKNNKQVAWIASGAPVEPLLAMDIIPVYPESHGAMIGASKMGGDFCAKAEEMGYSSDICAYARSDIASSVHKGGPLGGLPEPDMLICCNNICSTVLKWFEVQARFYNVPLFLLDTPICHTGYSSEAATYVQAQTRELVSFLEAVTKRKFNFEKMAQVGELSLEGQLLWQQVLFTTSHNPAPMSAFDAFFFMALIVTLRGTQITVDFYKTLLAEMEQRVKDGFGSVPNEKYRLLWDNLPIWYRLKWLSEKFSEHGACLVADTYTSAWCGAIKYIDGNNFLGSIGEAYTRSYLNMGVDQMAEEVLEMINFYGVDGLVMHSNRSCKPYSFGQMDLANIIRDKTGLPVLMIEADMVDNRNFSQSQIETRIDAFMEIIKQKRMR